MNEKIKAIIFDVGGVLALGKAQIKKHKKYFHNLGVHEFISNKLKISLDQYFDAIDTNYAKSIEGQITKKQVLEKISTNLKTTPKKIEKFYLKAYNKNFKQNKQLFKQAFKLKKLGYKIAILSDQWSLSKEILMPNKLYKNFDEVIVSCDVGLRKPNVKIYKLILKKLKIKSIEAIFIDNQKWNIKPAKKLGVKTILFKNNKQLFGQLVWKRLFK
jgi:epoxide hydrolase-like predicted phosphatase